MPGRCEATTTLRVRIQMCINEFEKQTRESPNGRAISSERIHVPHHESYEWRLCVFPNGQVVENVRCIAVMVFLLGPNKVAQKKVPATMSLYLLGKGDKRVRLIPKESPCVFQLPHHGCGRRNVKQERVVLREDGSLKVVAEVEFAPEQDGADDEPRRMWTQRLTDTLLAKGLHSDCTVKVGDNSYKAHKAVLAAHVPEFRALCEEEGEDATRRCKKPVIEITGFPIQPVKQMLYYLYTGSVLAEKMPECCEDVFHLAERYSITDLKQVALSFMAAQVDESNVVKMALIASKVPSQVLLQACARYIADHTDSVLASDEWKKLRSEKTELANKLLEMTLLDTAA